MSSVMRLILSQLVKERTASRSHRLLLLRSPVVTSLVAFEIPAQHNVLSVCELPWAKTKMLKVEFFMEVLENGVGT